LLLSAHFFFNLFKALGHWSILNFNILILNVLSLWLVLGLILNLLSFLWLTCLSLRLLLIICFRCCFKTLFLLLALFWRWWRSLFFLIVFGHVSYLYLWLGCHYFVDEVNLFLDYLLGIFTLLFQSLSFGTFAFFLRFNWLQSWRW